VRGVTPTVQDYVPSDAQIAFQLANFIRKTRGISSDPVVVRQNWLDAYDFATSRAAVTLSDYAAANDPFAEVGVKSVSIAIESVVRSSDSTFEVRWRETEFRTGVKQRSSSHTAQLTVVTDPPRDEATLQRNPLGLYVHAINWSQDHSIPTQTQGAITLILSLAALSGCSHLSKSTVPDFKLDDAIFEPAIIQSEITEATDEPQKPETVIVERFTRT